MKIPGFFILESSSNFNPLDSRILKPQKHEASPKPYSSLSCLSTTPLSPTQQQQQQIRRKEKERKRKHETPERIPSLHSAIHSSVEEKLSPLMAAQAILFSPDFLLSLLHLPHLHHREGHRRSLLHHHFLQERLRPRAHRLSSDSSLRGQVFRETTLL